MENLHKNNPESGSNQAANEVVPRLLTKKAIRSYLQISPRQYKRLVNDEVIQKMGLNYESHKWIKEYSFDQTKVIIECLELTREELLGMAKYMNTT